MEFIVIALVGLIGYCFKNRLSSWAQDDQVIMDECMGQDFPHKAPIAVSWDEISKFSAGPDCSTGIDWDSDDSWNKDFSSDSPDYFTDPLYSWMPGNIFHTDDASGTSCSGSDWMTDPTCSFMEGNIFHEDNFSTSISTDDSWSTSSFSDDSSSSSSSFDDW